MWHRIADVKLLVTMAVALLIVAALACGKDEAAPAAPAQAAKAALPAVQAEPDAPAGTVAGPGATGARAATGGQGCGPASSARRA